MENPSREELPNLARDIVNSAARIVPEGYAVVVVVTDVRGANIGVSGSHGISHALDMLRCAVAISKLAKVKRSLPTLGLLEVGCDAKEG